ncbi:unnamed protein product [Lampetra fluviatilis]
MPSLSVAPGHVPPLPCTRGRLRGTQSEAALRRRVEPRAATTRIRREGPRATGSVTHDDFNGRIKPSSGPVCTDSLVPALSPSVRASSPENWTKTRGQRAPCGSLPVPGAVSSPAPTPVTSQRRGEAPVACNVMPRSSSTSRF